MIFGDRTKEKREEKLQEGLAKTREGFFGRITGLLGPSDITAGTWDDLEALLIQADVGVDTTLTLVEGLREEANQQGIRRAADLQELLKEKMVAILEEHQHKYATGPRMLTVVLVVGVNGSGKTTSIAKLARYHRQRSQKVTLAAADTFRAAAIEQLQIWGERIGVPVIASQTGSDAGAVVYDAIRASQGRDADVLIVDTAGRLHTKYNLMEELKKIRAVAQRQVHRAPHETLLVLDATTGQNAIAQAEKFKEAVDVTGVFLAKLDGTAKGGVVFAIARELQLPVLFVGTGETAEDVAEFAPRTFVDGLFA